MEDKRAKTMQALSTFIESQKALVARTQADIAKLKSLRDDIAATPDGLSSLAAFEDKLLGLGGVKLSADPDVVPSLPRELEWSVFASSDPTPFRTLATATRSVRARQRQPSAKQTSSLSPLQQLVKNSRVTIIDPVLSSFPPLSEDEEEPPDPEELKRIMEREKIRELKRRMIQGDSFLHSVSGLGLRKAGVDAVFVRRDLEDESGEVDIDLGEDGALRAASSSSSRDVMDVDTPATSVLPSPATPSAPSDGGPSTSHSSRTRRPTQKAAQSRKHSAQASRKAVAPSPSSEAEEMSAGPLLDKKGKPRPETYKQAWSVSEQHLLERLLEEIPDGERNRWAKISQAMNGQRTARQVASRVQKYYEKLKRFGLDVGNNASSRGNST